MKLHDALSSISINIWLICLVLLNLTGLSNSRRPTGNHERSIPGVPHIASLRKETEDLFYHGYENYMKHAFPEDELRPVSCKPLSRDRDNPSHVEVNDVLGNYSLTLIDSLSTLATLASSPSNQKRNKPLLLFQNGVKDFVEQYGDGSEGPDGQGKRSRGFDLDSKVQVFETVIRGLGGLLSAHLFAVGELPILGYDPPAHEVEGAKAWDKTENTGRVRGIKWKNGMIYDGQLLRLAMDLGQRIVPAFWTSTGIPYPRVNLRYGIPFYANSAGNFAPEGQCDTEKKAGAEVTETCSAGAGSLVLEFTVLSRLTGDPKFEDLAKRAFWAIWNRRSNIDLIGAGIDAETGDWQHSWTGIGAGIDSFFEYAFKSYILLSGNEIPITNATISELDPRSLFGHLPASEHASDTFLKAWENAHTAIKRHMYRGLNFQHPHYIQVDISSGAPRAFWVDALSAYYPGLLALSGQVEEAIETHMTSAALWARFSALPERYSVATGGIEGGLGWWVGRPELIESTWYLYTATEDPWYVYVGEMIMRDIKRRCWTPCGWAGIQNVVTGDKTDRMESFFLGETAKYLFLLFTPDHPLNKLDRPFVFTTEGHPLIIPRPTTNSSWIQEFGTGQRRCPVKPKVVPFTVSNVSARGDIFHASSLARLHMMPQRGQVTSVLTEYAMDHPSLTNEDTRSPSNWTYYPWTLPLELIPPNALSSKMPMAPTFELAFPAMQNQGSTDPPLQRVTNGIMVNFLGGLRLSMVQDMPMYGSDIIMNAYRIQSINNLALGKDEKVYLAHTFGQKTLNPTDPLFTQVRDTVMLDIVVDPAQSVQHPRTAAFNTTPNGDTEIEIPDLNTMQDGTIRAAWNSMLSQLSNILQDASGAMIPSFSDELSSVVTTHAERRFISATTPTGIGAAPIPDWSDIPATKDAQLSESSLPWTKIYATDELCDKKLPAHILRTYQVLLVKRGRCSFSKKLSNIPNIHPGRSAFQLVIVVDHESENSRIVNDAFDAGADNDGTLIRPLLDISQTTSSGLHRQHPIPMVMVAGGEHTYQLLRNARGLGVKRRYSISSQGVPIANLIIV